MDEEPAPITTFDSLSLALAILRAFADGDRDNGLRLLQVLVDESDSILTLDEVVADMGSATLPIAGPARDVDMDAILSELADRLAKRLNE